MTNARQAFWLILALDGQPYALPLEPVSEVLRMVAVTPLPEAPAWVPGVIDVRGRVTPVIDLRARLGLVSAAPALSTRIVIVSLDGRQLGLLADEVAEVLTLPARLLDPPDSLHGAVHTVLGTLQVAERLILVLDLSRLCAGLDVPALPAP